MHIFTHGQAYNPNQITPPRQTLPFYFVELSWDLHKPPGIVKWNSKARVTEIV